MSTRKKWELDRRTFIKGMGITLGLPLLDAMIPSIVRAAGNKTQRLVWIYLPNGFGQPWADSGSYTFPNPVQNALSGLSGTLSTVSGLLVPGDQPAGTGNAHPDAFMPFINSGNMPTSTRGNTMSKTWDQYIADVNVGAKEKSISIVANYEDSVYLFSPLEAHTMSYRGASQPVGYYLNPKDLFDRIFSGTTSGTPAPNLDQKTKDQLNRKRGVLHYINEDIKALEAKVGKEDQIRLQEYFMGLDDLDRKIASQLGDTSSPTPMTCASPTGVSNGADYPTRLRMFYDILYFALKCDLTRVATVMHAMEGSHMVHSDFMSLQSRGVQWHAYSHLDPGYEGSSSDNNSNRADLQTIIAWHHAEIAKFVKRLKDTVLPNGQTMLDECAIVWGSSLSAGAGHDQRGLIVNIAGSANGALKQGANLNQGGAQLANLWLTLMQAFGVTGVNSIGRSNGIVNGLKV